MPSVESLGKAASAFASDFGGGLFINRTLNGKSLREAFAYYAVLLAVSCALSTAFQAAPLVAGASGGWGDVEAGFSEIPDFRIADGKFILVDNVSQPYNLSDGMVIDTTGKLKEPPVDKSGRGMLITEDAIISREPMKEEKIYFKDIEGTVKDRGSLIAFIKGLLLIMVPLLVVMFFGFNAAWYVIVSGSLAAAFVAASLAFGGKRLSPQGYAALAIFSQTPVLVGGVVSSAVASAVHLSVLGWAFTFASALWAAIVYYLAASPTKNA
jgi:hypothetical protein